MSSDKMEDTRFVIEDAEGNQILSGQIEWGYDMDKLYYNHPMTGQCTEHPLQGWADPHGVPTGHAEVRAVLEAIHDNDMFLEDHYGYDYVTWLFDGGKINSINHSGDLQI